METNKDAIKYTSGVEEFYMKYRVPLCEQTVRFGVQQIIPQNNESESIRPPVDGQIEPSR